MQKLELQDILPLDDFESQRKNSLKAISVTSKNTERCGWVPPFHLFLKIDKPYGFGFKKYSDSPKLPTLRLCKTS